MKIPKTIPLRWKAIPLFTALAILFFLSCKKEEPSNDYVAGKNHFITQVDGDDREYYVHVPQGYDGSTAFPVVFMCHGTSGDGQKFYNISGWKEVGETENILTVYPSSWRYCIIDDGVVKTTTKWNIYPTPGWTYCAGETPRDDIKFIRTIIDELKGRFNVAEKQVYLLGFSNGGAFAGRCAVELSDKLAATVSNGGFLPADTIINPTRLLPVICQLGNSDNKWTVPFGIDTFPMNFDTLLTQLPGFQFFLNTYINSFELESTYTTGGDPSQYIWADYDGLSGDPNNQFRFVLVNSLGHNYPNGTNHPMMGAEVHWSWIKNFSRP